MRIPVALILTLLLSACGDSTAERREDAAEARREAAEELQEGDTADAREELEEAQRLEADTLR